MDRESLVQPNREMMFFEMDPELAGHLEVPEHPEAYGGYADIYHGVWISPEGQRVEVAVKELKDFIAKDEQIDSTELIKRRDTRMKREVFVWRQMEHPNIHPLLGYCSKPQPRLISPWCRHGNLTRYLGKNPRLCRLAKLRLIFQAACGLDHLHAQTPPVCHADIKPENVLVNDFVVAALSDFGLSRVLDAFGGSGLTTSECAKGTYNYIAPELFNEGKLRPTLMTDVYAFGGLILTVMSGKRPFWDLHHPAIFYRVMNDQPPKPEDHQDLPSSDPLWGLMRRCWNKTPGARPPMQEVLKELWGEICKEEFDLWSEPSVSRKDDTDPSYMDIDTPLRSLGTVAENDSLPSTQTVGRPRGIVSEETFIEARKILDTLVVDSKIIPAIGGYIAAATDVGSILLELANTMDRNERMARSIGFSTLRLINHLEQLRDTLAMRKGEGVAARVASVQRELQDLQKAIDKWCSSGVFLSAFSCCDSVEGLKWCEGAIQRVQEEIQLLVALEITNMVIGFRNTEMQKEHRRLLDRLGNGYHGVMGTAIEDVTCLHGTRVEILQQIDDWVRGTLGSERALWIRGMAGRGKSTLASTVAHNWRFRASCAIFHYRRGRDTLNAQVVCALARQLGNGLVEEVRNAVVESIQENDDIANQHLSEQFSTLLVASLRKLKEHPYPVLIIVDALDECGNDKDVVDFVRLIHRHSSSFPANVKFLLTCRPEAALIRALEPNKWDKLDLDSTPGVSNDVARFIYHACTQIRDDHALSESWPSSADLARLVDMSQGLFQWARTAITYIGDGSPVDRLRDLLQGQATWGGLEELYHQILSKAMDKISQEPKKRRLLRSILGTLVVAPHPVSLEVIATLYGDSDMFKGTEPDNMIQFLRHEILVDCNSLLHIPTSASESVCFMHTSIRDLLISRERCQKTPYYVDPVQHHRQLARLSLSLMLRLLKENICGLSDLSQAVSEIQHVAEHEVQQALRYCCQAWSVHLTQGLRWSEPQANDVTGQLDNFISFSQTKVLGWMEVMSVIGAIGEGSTMAKQVYSWLVRCPSEIFEVFPLVNLWNDIHRFMAAFLEPISFGPLHIYASALPHCPCETELWRLYGSSAKVRILGSHQMSTWPPNLWTRTINGRPNHVAFSEDGSLVITGTNTGNAQFWETETGRQGGETVGDCGKSAWCVGVSPDGRVLARGFPNVTIRLWDIQTGRQLGEPLTDHSSDLDTIYVSSDGRVLASVSEDDTIRLWDTQTGRQLGEPLTDHSDTGTLYHICFSPDRKVLATVCEDSIIQLWNTQTGRQLGELLTGDGDTIYHICFSPDGKVLASASEDRTVRLWDTQTGRQLGEPLTGHSDTIYHTCFSPDGKVLASASKDRTVRLWDTQTGRQLDEPLTGHSSFVQCVCFSPDGRVLASGSGDETIRLWDTQTGRQLGEPLTGHSGDIVCVCFLPNGRVLASESEDGTIRLWDTQTGRQLDKLLTGSNLDAQSVRLSPDARVLVSRSRHETVQLWDTRTGRQLGELLAGLSSAIWCVCFSPDGRVLASGSGDKTIRLWDTQTWGQLGEPLTGHSTSVRCICFTPDSRVLASGSEGNTIRLWDIQTGRQLGKPLTGHSGTIQCVCFSADGRVLASGSDDNTIRLWETRTRRQLGEPLAGHSRCVQCICFSPDGRVLASGSKNNTIQLWDIQKGRQLGEPLNGHSDTVRCVCFSADGRVLASGSDDKTIRLWDTQTGRPSSASLTGHSRDVWSVCVSPDGRALVSEAPDHTLQLWDIQTGRQLGEPLIVGGVYVSFICFSPDNRVLVSISKDRTVQLSDTQTGRQLGELLAGRISAHWGVCFSPDGRVLAFGSLDHTIRLWDIQRGRQLGEPLTCHSSRVSSVCFSPDGRVLAAGLGDGTIRLWDTHTGRQLGEPLTGHSSNIHRVCFSPDGRVLASGCHDHTIRLWDTQTGRQLGEPLTGHSRAVWCVCFSPDGRVLASGCCDEKIRLWDTQTGRQLGEPLIGHRTSVHSVSFSPDGVFLTGNQDSADCHIWDVRNLQKCHPPRRVPSPGDIRLQDHWITHSSQRLLWLPAEYWTTKEDLILLSDRTLAVAHGKTVSFFDLSRLPWSLDGML